MTARATPYPLPGYAVRVPKAVWEAALETMRSYGSRRQERGRRGSEALVYLAGVVAGQEMVVTGLYRLDHAAQGDRVVVTPAESRWLVKTLRVRDEKLVGQLHSHRGGAGHSLGDDRHATSFHEGFLSIVVPHFGRDASRPEQCAVLEYRGGTFVELEGEEIRARIHVGRQLVNRDVMRYGVKRRGSWFGFGKRLRSIGRRRR